MGGPAHAGRRSREPAYRGSPAQAPHAVLPARTRRPRRSRLLEDGPRPARATVPVAVLARVARDRAARDHFVRPRQAAEGALPPRAADAGRGVALRLLALVLLARRDHAPGQR